MRWPFGPPHLTLKPSKKNTKKQSNKKTKKNKKKRSNKKKQKYPKKRFSVVSQIFPYLVCFQNFPFFDTLAQKACTQKTLENRGFSEFFFGKRVVCHETAIFGQKNPNA